MDVLSKHGRETLLQVEDALEIWHRNFPTMKFIATPFRRPADVDGMIVMDDTVVGVVEVKCRVSMSLLTFKSYDSEWLVTFDKVIRGMAVADALQVPFIGFLYFPKERTLFYKTIYDPIDGVRAPFRVARTQTQATVNGGKISRDNAYIDMRDAKRLQ